jgi:type II secretory pathway component PulK
MTFKDSNCSRHQCGIALIIVLLVITVLAILAGGFAYSMKVETQLARNASFDDELFWVAWAGLENAKYELALDLQGSCAQFDSFLDYWADGPGCDQLNPAAAAGQTDPAAPAVSPGHRLDIEPDRHVTWKTTDAERKFNINIAGQPILQQAMTLIGLDPASHSTVMDSIADWIDPDDDAKTSGAESEFYQSGQGPYGSPHNAKNATIDDISELLMINGITRGIYEGSGGIDTAAPLATVAAAQSRFDEPIYAVGLRDLFCTVSSRTLNINTASETTLQLLPPVDANIAAAIIQRRAGPDGIDGTGDDTPFRNVQDIGSIPGLPPPVMQQILPYVGVRSQVFEIAIEAHIGGQHRTYTAVVARNNPRDITVLAFAPKWE